MLTFAPNMAVSGHPLGAIWAARSFALNKKPSDALDQFGYQSRIDVSIAPARARLRGHHVETAQLTLELEYPI
jgi:hypothetical protein